MKNSIKITVASAFLLLQFGASAQKLRVGLQGGRTAATQVYDSDSFQDRLNRRVGGGNVSAFVNWKLAKKASIQTGLGLSQRGSKCYPGWVGDAQLRVSYLELPIELQVSQPLFGHFSLSVGAGCNVARAFSARRKYKTWDGGTWVKERFKPSDNPDQYHVWDFALEQTVGLEYRLGPKNALLLNARATEGLRDFIQWTKTKNRVLELRAGFSRSI